MWKAAISVVTATIGVFAVVLAATVMLIEASIVDTTTMSDRPVPKRCRASGNLSLPLAPFLLPNISAMTPHSPQELLARRASLEG